jgi:PucR C-terminal helix-turn-helix domain
VVSQPEPAGDNVPRHLREQAIAAERERAQPDKRLGDADALLDRADGSWQRAAAEVHVHKKTLGYRLRKAEELTGRGFARIQHLAEWWFAMKALDLLTARRRPPQPK